jgi:D-beta-D-heptose 7-phosphate kinase/D-beta-D-heptose 1-phosphate adenosyltransferase
VRSAVLGGAANTAANTVSLGHPTVLIGAVGDDAEGRECRELAAQGSLDTDFVTCVEIPTTTKTRFLSGNHQIMRWDKEKLGLLADSHAAIVERVNHHLVDAAALVISDYDKGAVSPQTVKTLIAQAQQRGVPVIVDTKKTDISCFAGASVIAPNHLEAQAITGESSPEKAARAIAEITGHAALVTLGADGMMIVEDGEATQIPSQVHEVSDVTGAGDTVTAGLAVALAEGATQVRDAAQWANRAAGVAVSHAGTYAVPRAAVGDFTL